MLTVVVANLVDAPFAIASDGFGGSATGGAGGTQVTVSTALEFSSYVTSPLPYIITVTGTIQLNGNAIVASDKTIQGADTNATIVGDLYIGSGTRNVIVRNLTLTNPLGLGDGDGMTILGGRNVFVTHCTFVDCMDGECDITVAADSVTVSWCRFRYVTQAAHRNTMLIGSSDAYLTDLGYLHVTIHHCWFDQGCSERLPSVRFGRVHVYNNYYSGAGNNYCVRTRLYAECLVENNFFEDVQNPWELLTTTGLTGKLRAVGNNVMFMDTSGGVSWVSGWYPGQSLISGIDIVFTPPYPYSLDTAETVKMMVISQAGNRGGAMAVDQSQTNVSRFSLLQNYPNPFNPRTEIGFRVADCGLVTLKVYDVLGCEVATLVSEVKKVGTYTVTLDASEMTSGIYFYSLRSGSFVDVKKLIVLK